MELHSFFQPCKQLSNKQALAHRRRITAQHPSLPNRAGRSFQIVEAEALRIMKRLEEESPQDPTKPVRMPVRRGKTYVRAVPLAKPEVDVQLLAKALLDLVESEMGEKAA